MAANAVQATAAATGRRVTLYSLVAWPPSELAGWMQDLQGRLNLAAYGAPHLNLRAPFEWAGPEAELDAQLRRALRGLSAFEVHLIGWQRFPHTIFLGVERSPAVWQAHTCSLQLSDAPPSARDAEAYRPHLTLALGLLPWAEDAAWQAAQPHTPPTAGWTARELALTRDEGGEISTLETYRLG